MIIALMILQFIGSIILWLTIASVIRTLKIKPGFSLVASLVLSIIFLVLSERLSIMFPMYYLICGLVYSLYTLFNVIRYGGKSKITILINTIGGFCFWPQSVCYNLFLYSISDAGEENT